MKVVAYPLATVVIVLGFLTGTIITTQTAIAQNTTSGNQTSTRISEPAQLALSVIIRDRRYSHRQYFVCYRLGWHRYTRGASCSYLGVYRHRGSYYDRPGYVCSRYGSPHYVTFRTRQAARTWWWKNCNRWYRGF